MTIHILVAARTPLWLFQQLHTVSDVLSLDEEAVKNILGVGMKQIIHLYRRVIFG